MNKALKKIRATLVIITFACLSGAPIVQAQDLELSAPDLYFAAIIVSDMDTSLLWYQEVLGYKVVNQADNEERGIRQSNLVNGHSSLELIQMPQSGSIQEQLNDRGAKKMVEGIFKIGVRVPDFDAWVNHLQNKEATFYGRVVTDAQSGKKMVIILDPDGNRVQFFEN